MPSPSYHLACILADRTGNELWEHVRARRCAPRGAAPGLSRPSRTSTTCPKARLHLGRSSRGLDPGLRLRHGERTGDLAAASLGGLVASTSSSSTADLPSGLRKRASAAPRPASRFSSLSRPSCARPGSLFSRSASSPPPAADDSTDIGRLDQGPGGDGGGVDFICIEPDDEACDGNTHLTCEASGEFLSRVDTDCTEVFPSGTCIEGIGCAVCRPGNPDTGLGAGAHLLHRGARRRGALRAGRARARVRRGRCELRRDRRVRLGQRLRLPGRPMREPLRRGDP